MLDLFGGSGGIGIEALSRGMDRAVFIDMDKKAIETIHLNLRTAGLEGQAEVYRNDAHRAIKALAKREARFELVMLDPPYRLKIADELILQMEEAGIIGEQSTIVVEYEAGHAYPEQIGQFQAVRTAEYGETAIRIYKYAQEPEGDNEHNEP